MLFTYLKLQSQEVISMTKLVEFSEKTLEFGKIGRNVPVKFSINPPSSFHTESLCAYLFTGNRQAIGSLRAWGTLGPRRTCISRGPGDPTYRTEKQAQSHRLPFRAVFTALRYQLESANVLEIAHLLGWPENPKRSFWPTQYKSIC